MAYEKVVQTRIWGVTTQNSTVRLTVGDSSGGTFTAITNPLRGSLVWDEAMFVLTGVAVAGGATGGSYTVALQTDAIRGYTGLPIASATLGPNSPKSVAMNNQHQCKGAPLPTHCLITQTAAGGGLSFQMYTFAKQWRGVMSNPGGTAERVLFGTMVRATSYSGGPFVSAKGFVASETVTVGGNSVSTMGLHKMRLWGTAFYWVVAGESLSGTHDASMIATVGGKTFTVASTGAAGALSAAGQKVALANSFYGQSPNPSHLIWTVVSAGGVSDARVVVVAKTARGSMAKY